MELKAKAIGMARVLANIPKVDALKKEKPTKLNNLAIYMLKGFPVTGALMVAKFNIYSYRDAIYDLTKKGYKISSTIIVGEKGVTHKLWWMSEFPEEFIKDREENPWNSR